MISVKSEVNQWYECLKNQKLEDNDRSVEVWNKYKSDLEVTKSLVSLLPKKVTHKVMVPIGPRALIPGQIVHTNEFLVSLGASWFVKRTGIQTEEICKRKIKTCEEMLDKLKKEKELILNKSDLPGKKEAFGNQERPEIIEFVTEEENEEWKKQHRIKEREYRQKLAKLRAQEKKQIQTEKDLWEHLDRLELQEELEDELNRLNAENDVDEYLDNDEVICNEIENEEAINDQVDKQKQVDSVVSEFSRKQMKQNELPSSDISEKGNFCQNSIQVEKKRKVSFAFEIENSLGNDDQNDEPLRLKIKFSNIEPAIRKSVSSSIQSPADIYERFLQSGYSQKSVLKSKENPNREKELCKFEKEKLSESGESESENENEIEERNDVLGEISNGILFRDVTERNPFIKEASNNNEKVRKKISKFKASRIKAT